MLEETEHEYRRLLYVAMTRAADRLIVAGCMPGNRNSVRENSWYDLIKRGLANSDLALQEIPSRRRRGETLQASGRRNARDRHRRRSCRQARTHRCRHGCAPRLRASQSPTDRLRPSDPGADEGKTFRSRRIARTARARASARHAGASAAAIAARCRDRTPPRRRAAIPRPQCRAAGPTATARRWRKRCWP